jgi:hypothetical protein
MQFDTTALPNGSHTFQLTVTDTSNRSTTSTVLTINNVNEAPSIGWVSPADNSTVSGVVTLKALAAPASTGTAKVTKWCLTRDGVPITTDVAVYDFAYSDLDFATFNGITGCWSRTSGILTGAMQFDTTALPNGSHTFQLTVTDTSNRSTSATRTLQVDNPVPSFVPLTPARVLDTRGGAKVGDPWGTGAPLRLNVLNRGGLPGSGIGAVALNVTVVAGEDPAIGGGFVTVYPCGGRPDASNLNFRTGQTIPNSVIAPVSAGGDICFYVYGTAHLLADVSGYFPA